MHSTGVLLVAEELIVFANLVLFEAHFLPQGLLQEKFQLESAAEVAAEVVSPGYIGDF